MGLGEPDRRAAVGGVRDRGPDAGRGERLERGAEACELRERSLVVQLRVREVRPDAFDPEAFDLAAVNRKLRRLK